MRKSRKKTDLMPETKLYNGDCLDIMQDIPDKSVERTFVEWIIFLRNHWFNF